MRLKWIDVGSVNYRASGIVEYRIEKVRYTYWYKCGLETRIPVDTFKEALFSCQDYEDSLESK